MWAFQDKGGRDVCLIPEATGLIQELWRDKWQGMGKPMKLFYVSRCYRYDRPQKDRYREFTQFGVELLGDIPNGDQESQDLLKSVLDNMNVNYTFDDSAKRGLTYYTDLGFEARCEALGAQKQIAGGGRYAEGVGWAIGIERLISARASKSV